MASQLVQDILGNKAVSPNFLGMTDFQDIIILLVISLVLLQIFGGSILCSSIVYAPSFSNSLCGAVPVRSRLLKNSFELSGPRNWQGQLIYWIFPLQKTFKSLMFIYFTKTFFSAKKKKLLNHRGIWYQRVEKHPLNFAQSQGHLVSKSWKTLSFEFSLYQILYLNTFFIDLYFLLCSQSLTFNPLSI